MHASADDNTDASTNVGAYDGTIVNEYTHTDATTDASMDAGAYASADASSDASINAGTYASSDVQVSG